jgi:FixJ family two-component response regulator
VARQAQDELAELRKRYETLTAREREVMSLVVSGMLNKQIAAELGNSEDTVRHREDPTRPRNAEDESRITCGIGQNSGEIGAAARQEVT